MKPWPDRYCRTCRQYKPHREFVPRTGTQAVLETSCSVCRRGRLKRADKATVNKLADLGRIHEDDAYSRVARMETRAREIKSAAAKQRQNAVRAQAWDKLLRSVNRARESVYYARMKADRAGELKASVWCTKVLEGINATRRFITRTKFDTLPPEGATLWWHLLDRQDRRALAQHIKTWPEGCPIACPIRLPNL